MLLPFVISGIPKKLIDRTYCGVIEDVEVTTSNDVDMSWGKRGRVCYKNVVYLKIKTDDGGVIYKKVHSAISNKINDIQIQKYKVGERVFHLYGTPHTIIISKKSNEAIECAVCGSLNSHEHVKCRYCGHTLLSMK